MIKYKTISRAASAEQTIEKSRFIAYASPAADKGAAEAFISQIRDKHRDATHNVPVMVLGEKMQIQWASDDGEPSGTSGAPVVQMLVKEGISNIVIVITRYFGGIKLGTGGLVRAYTSSAKLALQAAGICTVRDRSIITAELDYTYLAKLQNAAQQCLNEKLSDSDGVAFSVKDIIYEDKVIIKLSTEPEQYKDLELYLNNLTNGSCRVLQQKIEEEICK